VSRCDVKRELGSSSGLLEIAAEPVGERESGGEAGEILVGLVGGNQLEGLLHPCERLVTVAGVRVDPTEAPESARGTVAVALRLEQGDCPLDERAGRVGIACPRGHLARPVEERRLLGRRIRQLRRLLE
jgi:hypothetical protein